MRRSLRRPNRPTHVAYAPPDSVCGNAVRTASCGRRFVLAWSDAPDDCRALDAALADVVAHFMLVFGCGVGEKVEEGEGREGEGEFIGSHG